MKKSVIVVIIIVYIASIFFVGFFGIAVRFVGVTTYVTGVQCINESRNDQTGKPLIKVKNDEENNITHIQILDFMEIYKHEGQSLKIDWRVYPDYATEKGVNFEYNKESSLAEMFYVDEENGIGIVQGTVHFTEKAIPTDGKTKISLPEITLKAADGLGAFTRVKISYQIILEEGEI